MRIDEVISDINSTKLAALSQFLLGRARDTSAKRTISTTAFLKLAYDIGINLSIDQLIEISQVPPLSNIIATMNQHEITFVDPTQPNEVLSVTPDVDRDQQIVGQMAKRAGKNVVSASK